MAFYYRSNNETCGPVSADELTALFNKGILSDDSLVIEEGAPAWSTYREVAPPPAPEPEPEPAPEPPPAPAPEPPPAPAPEPPPAPATPPPAPTMPPPMPTMPPPAAPGKPGPSPKEQAMALLEKSKPMLGVAQKGTFLFCYLLSFFLLACAILALLITGLGYIFSSKVDVPEFDKFKERVELSSSLNGDESSENDTKKRIGELEDSMRAICKDLELDELKKMTDRMAGKVIRRVKKENVSDWLSGWEDCLTDTADYCDKQGMEKDKKEIMCAQAAEWYMDNFEQDSKEPEEKLLYLLIALVALMLALPLPVLLRIERNTRTKKA